MESTELMSFQDDEWLTLAQIAEMLHVNPSTVRLWVSQERLPAHKPGLRKWLVRRSDLEAMLSEHPDLAQPRGTAGSAPEKDWSAEPEAVSLNLAASVQPPRGLR